MKSVPVKNPLILHAYLRDREALASLFQDFHKSFRKFFRPFRARFYHLKDLVVEVVTPGLQARGGAPWKEDAGDPLQDPKTKSSTPRAARLQSTGAGNLQGLKPLHVREDEGEKGRKRAGVVPFFPFKGRGVIKRIPERLSRFRPGEVGRLVLDGAVALHTGKRGWRRRQWCSHEHPALPILRVTIYQYEVVFESRARCFAYHHPRAWAYTRALADTNFNRFRDCVNAFQDRLGYRLDKIELDWYKEPPPYYGVEMDRVDDAFRGMREYNPMPFSRLEHRLNYALIDTIDELLEPVDEFLDQHWEGVAVAGTRLTPHVATWARSYASAIRQLLDEIKEYSHSITGIPLRKLHHEYIPQRLAPTFLKLQDLIRINDHIEVV